MRSLEPRSALVKSSQDFPTGDEHALLENIREKLFVLPDDTVVYPGHGETTLIRKEKKMNPFF